jgi:hypothetical protein
MNSKNSTQIVTGNTPEELREKVQKEIIERGWETDGVEYKNPDGTFSQKMKR